MKKPEPEQISKFILFAFPCYWTFALLFIALAIWKVGVTEPDLVPVVLISIAVITAAAFLVNGRYFVTFPMMALGAYIALMRDQHAEGIFRLFGIYLILHYAICLFYVIKSTKNKR